MHQSASCCWVDSHCHLDFPAFDEDREVVLARARSAGVVDFVVPGIAASSWQGLDVLAVEPGVHTAFGLHPWWAIEHRPEHLEMLKEHLSASHPVAIGECGLDFSLDIDRDVQRHWFVAQLRLAADFNLPVIVHAVRALDEVLRELAVFPGLTGVIHGFSGSQQQAEQCVKAGLMLGIGPGITRSSRLRTVVDAMPLDCLLLETDAPDRPVAGSRGEPAHILQVGEVMAAIKRMTPEELAQITSVNARKLFAWGYG